jgi:hypothetical protein
MFVKRPPVTLTTTPPLLRGTKVGVLPMDLKVHRSRDSWQVKSSDL